MIRTLAVSVLFILAAIPGTMRGQVFDDEFNGFVLGSKWSWVREDRAFWSLDGSALQITTQLGALNGTDYNDVRNILLQDALPLGSRSFAFFTKLDFQPDSILHNAGLIYRVDDDNYIRVSRGMHDNIDGVWMEVELRGRPDLYFVADVRANPIYLKLERVDDYSFRSSFNTKHPDSAWTQITERTIAFPAGQAKIGLQAANGQGTVTTRRIPARFDYFRVITNGVDDEAHRIASLPAIQGLYPSPASSSGTMTVDCVIPDERATIRLTDLLGRTAWSGTIDRSGTNRQSMRVPLRGISAGTYVVMLEGTTATSRRTVVVY